MQKFAIILTAAALVATPVVAQNTGEAQPTVTTEPAPPPTPEQLNSATSIPPAQETPGLTAGPGAAPATTEPGAVDTAYGEPREVERDGFPWGVLGLLGLLGLIPRKSRRRPDTDRVRTDDTNRADRL